ncbi:hypothetical protein NOV72_04985 [Caballeronia novacaledonica]|uniref:Uncharacterized protein n=1 Tax=Caballeronia novacaledonica TaxID=1544861 RepID=A0A2U3IC53_9BURK|nr:hypothetical protein [Caballeronia novacaledonica]SPB17780.1 hypothetical protein NOV72_04985 [Caballeronia novacaledonica]
MDDFLIAFGALWVVICVYAILAHHFKPSASDDVPPCTIPPWFEREEFAANAYAMSASGSLHPRESRGNSPRRLLRCAGRSPERVRSSRR